MRDYETLRRRHHAYAVALAERLIERLDWPEDRLELHREQRLRELVREAVKRSAWHRERLAGIDPRELDEVSLRDLPTMTKADLMENFDSIVTDHRLSLGLVNDHLHTVSTGSYLFDGYTAITSGGSTGERGVFLYDWHGWATFWASTFRYALRAKWSDPELASRPVVFAWVTAAHFTHASAALSRTFAGPEFLNLRFPVTLPTEEITAGLNRAQPDYLVAYPSALHVLSVEAREGRLRIAPQRVFSCAEPLLPETRAAAEQAWEVAVGNVWAASEAGGIGIACDQARMHLSEDLLIVEAVDETGRPVAPGEPSAKLYLTNLYNRDLPLIRYEITDEVTIETKPCTCGSAHRTVADVQGRLDDVFVYDGRRVHPHVFRSVLADHAAVVEYQVRQTAEGAQIALRCSARVDLDRVRAETAGALAGLGVERPVVDVTAVDRLERDPGPAKLRRFVPLGSQTRHRRPRLPRNGRRGAARPVAPAAL